MRSVPTARVCGPAAGTAEDRGGGRTEHSDEVSQSEHGGDGDPRDGDAWTLRAGDVAVVQHVEDDGDYFQLQGGSGQQGDVTGLIRVSSYWSYADA
jgi:hypothetical protein